MTPDCLTCGACCRPPEPQPVYADLRSEDLTVLAESPKALALAVIVPGDRVFALRTKVTRDGVVCAALNGRIGKSVSCSIYNVRPRACRLYEAGSVECHNARVAVGLESARGS